MSTTGTLEERSERIEWYHKNGFSVSESAGTLIKGAEVLYREAEGCKSSKEKENLLRIGLISSMIAKKLYDDLGDEWNSNIATGWYNALSNMIRLQEQE